MEHSYRPEAMSFFDCDAVILAQNLIGCRLSLAGVGGVIVETEAYTEDDPASHTFKGKTLRNAPMYGAPGDVYVYRLYGLHWCLNVVAGQPGSAVLLRAIEPDMGLAKIVQRRKTEKLSLLCAGPGRLCEALGVNGAYNGLSVASPPFKFEPCETVTALVKGPRIGISRGAELVWRFGKAGSRLLSRSFPKQ